VSLDFFFFVFLPSPNTSTNVSGLKNKGAVKPSTIYILQNHWYFTNQGEEGIHPRLMKLPWC
jgi:hypothetical protein